MITSEIESNNKWDVEVIDLPGLFLHTYMDEVVNMRMLGKLPEMVVLADRPFVEYD